MIIGYSSPQYFSLSGQALWYQRNVVEPTKRRFSCGDKAHHDVESYLGIRRTCKCKQDRNFAPKTHREMASFTHSNDTYRRGISRESCCNYFQSSPLEKLNVFRNNSSVMYANQTFRERILNCDVQVLLHLCFCPLWPNFIYQKHSIIDL